MRLGTQKGAGLLLLFLILFPAVVGAEEGEAATVLSLRQCIEIALENQSDMLTGANSLIRAKADKVKAFSSYFPQVSVRNTTILEDEGFGTGRDDSTSLSVTQNFFDSGLREAGVRSARAALEQNLLSLERTEQAVIYQVTSGFYSLLRAMKLAEVQDIRVEYLEGQLELVKTNVAVGQAAEVDTLPVEAQLANARVDRLAAMNSVRKAAIQLQNTMGLTPSLDFSVAAPDQEQTPDMEILELEDYIEKAMTQRPELGQSQAGIIAAKSGLKVARINLWPRLTISGQYDRQLDPGDDDTLLISGAVNFDIFDGDSNRADYRKSKASLSNAQIQAEQMVKDITAQVQEAYLNLANAGERLTVGAISVKVAHNNLEVQQARYKEGLAIPLDLLNAQLEVVTAESNIVQARYDYYTAMAQIEYAIGSRGEYGQ